MATNTGATKGKVIHRAFYSPEEHITFQEEVTFWRNDGYDVEIQYGEQWRMIVRETVETNPAPTPEPSAPTPAPVPTQAEPDPEPTARYIIVTVDDHPFRPGALRYSARWDDWQPIGAKESFADLESWLYQNGYDHELRLHSGCDGCGADRLHTRNPNGNPCLWECSTCGYILEIDSPGIPTPEPENAQPAEDVTKESDPAPEPITAVATLEHDPEPEPEPEPEQPASAIAIAAAITEPARVVVEGKTLLDALKLLKGAVATKATLPVLANVLLRCSESQDPGTLYLTGTNLEVGIEAMAVPAAVSGDLALTVPYKLLTESVTPKGPVTLTADPARRELTAQQGKMSTTLKGISAEEFPIIPNVDTDPCAYMSAGTLHRTVERVTYAASKDGARPVLAAVLMRLHRDSSVTFAAADGFRLSRHIARADVLTDIPAGTDTDTLDLLIPAASFEHLTKLQGWVSVYVTPSRSQVLFTADNCRITSRLVEGNYVDLERVIPTEHQTRLTVDRGEFQDALKALKPYARESANITRLQWQDGTFSLTAATVEVGERTVTVDATGEGETAGAWAYNLGFLQDVAATCAGPALSIALQTPGAPAVLTDPSDPDTLAVLMPMYLGNK